MAGWTLGVAAVTLVATCIGILVVIVRGSHDRKISEETRDAVKATQREVTKNRKLSEAYHSMALAQQRLQSLLDFEAATNVLEMALQQVPASIDTDRFASCRARMLACLPTAPEGSDGRGDTGYRLGGNLTHIFTDGQIPAASSNAQLVVANMEAALAFLSEPYVQVVISGYSAPNLQGTVLLSAYDSVQVHYGAAGQIVTGAA